MDGERTIQFALPCSIKCTFINLYYVQWFYIHIPPSWPPTLHLATLVAIAQSCLLHRIYGKYLKQTREHKFRETHALNTLLISGSFLLFDNHKHTNTDTVLVCSRGFCDYLSMCWCWARLTAIIHLAPTPKFCGCHFKCFQTDSSSTVPAIPTFLSLWSFHIGFHIVRFDKMPVFISLEQQQTHKSTDEMTVILTQMC